MLEGRRFDPARDYYQVLGIPRWVGSRMLVHCCMHAADASAARVCAAAGRCCALLVLHAMPLANLT